MVLLLFRGLSLDWTLTGLMVTAMDTLQVWRSTSPGWFPCVLMELAWLHPEVGTGQGFSNFESFRNGTKLAFASFMINVQNFKSFNDFQLPEKFNEPGHHFLGSSNWTTIQKDILSKRKTFIFSQHPPPSHNDDTMAKVLQHECTRPIWPHPVPVFSRSVCHSVRHVTQLFVLFRYFLNDVVVVVPLSCQNPQGNAIKTMESPSKKSGTFLFLGRNINFHITFWFNLCVFLFRFACRHALNWTCPIKKLPK